jgi:hypothetical protein
MTVQLVTALHAAETLATYHRERAENSAGDAHAFHQDMDRRCSDDAEDIKRKIAGSGVTVEDQDLALRQRDLATAHAIIDRHQIMHGILASAQTIIDRHQMMHGIPVEDVTAAREAMAQDIASALFLPRGEGYQCDAIAIVEAAARQRTINPACAEAALSAWGL